MAWHGIIIYKRLSNAWNTAEIVKYIHHITTISKLSNFPVLCSFFPWTYRTQDSIFHHYFLTLRDTAFDCVNKYFVSMLEEFALSDLESASWQVLVVIAMDMNSFEVLLLHEARINGGLPLESWDSSFTSTEALTEFVRSKILKS